MHHTTNAALPCLQDSKVHVYSLENGTLKAVKELSHTGAITCLEFSPDGAYLAVGDSNRKVCLYQCPDYEVCILLATLSARRTERSLSAQTRVTQNYCVIPVDKIFQQISPFAQ